jgi:thiosulfate dehydrogenase [quinone] large subunit
MDTNISPERENGTFVSSNLFLPLRLFMGFTFLYAGLQHLTDPSFFDPSKSGYIGHLISQYAVGSPIHDFLLTVAPNAVMFGWLVAVGEVLIGIATLTGFLFRPAALAGLTLNFMFFLSATWNAFPFYFGSDIVFVMCWFTLLLTGPQPSLSVDGSIAKNFHALGWLVTKPATYTAQPQKMQPRNESPVPLSTRASLYPNQVREVNKAFDRIKQQFVTHRETVTILEFVRALIISLGVDRTDTPRLLNGIQNLVNRKEAATL